MNTSHSPLVCAQVMRATLKNVEALPLAAAVLCRDVLALSAEALEKEP